MLAGHCHRTCNRNRDGTAHADGVIEDRINTAEKCAAEGWQAVREKIVQSVALIDASNFYTAALVSSFHRDSLSVRMLTHGGSEPSSGAVAESSYSNWRQELCLELLL